MDDCRRLVGRRFRHDVDERFALVHAQSLLQTGQRKAAVQVLTGIQKSFDDDLLNLWLGLLWVQAEDLRNASAVSQIVSRGESLLVASSLSPYKG